VSIQSDDVFRRDSPSSLQDALDSADAVNGSRGFSGFMNGSEEDRLEMYSSMVTKKKLQLVDIVSAYGRRKGVRLVGKDVIKDILELSPVDLGVLQGTNSHIVGRWNEDPMAYMALMDQYCLLISLVYPLMGERIRSYSMIFLRTVSRYDWKTAASYESRIRSELHYRMFERQFDMH
jgi:hypothetical protein